MRRLVLAGLLWCASAAQAGHYTVPLLVPAGTVGEPQGVLRIINATDASGTVEIYAIDDAGTRSGPVTLTLNASASIEYTATQLQGCFTVQQGLNGCIDPQMGDARLQIETDIDIVPLAFVRAADGTLSAMHDTVRAVSADSSGQFVYEVPVFNPSTEMVQVSRLRFINPGDEQASVTIGGRDDSGAEASGGDVTLTLAAGGATTLTAQQLEAGDTDLTGQLGAGTGKWRLRVASDQPLEVVNIVASTAGYWHNLSTTAVAGTAPADQAGLIERFAGQSVIYNTSLGRSTFEFADGDRFTETTQSDGVTETYTGSYSYTGVGPDAGRLTLEYDDGDTCRANMYFASRTSGWLASHCTGSEDPDGTWIGGTWFVEDDDGDGDDSTEVAETTYEVNDALPGVPTSGAFAPNITGGGTIQITGSGSTVSLNNSAYFELDDGTRYTCATADGCTITNGTVTAGTVTGRAPGAGEVDRFPSFRTAAAPGNQTYTVGTAIDTLTLPEATGGNGELTYSLSPDVPGLSFNATARQLTGTPSTAGSHAMTYTVTDEDGDTDTLGFSITISAGTSTEGSLGVCQVGMTLMSGQSCTYPGTTDEFSVNERGRGRFLTFLAGIRIRINNQRIDGRVYDFEALHQGDGVWRIDRIAGNTEVPTTGGGMGSMDDDNDGVLNADDAFPQDPDESVDTDGDGIGDNADTDDDNDGVSDADDACPLDADNNCGQASEPDLVIQSASASNVSPGPGDAFTLSATVRNQGVGQADATTLRYYRSTDATISTADTEIGTGAVSALAASGTVDHSISLTAPSTAGTYYYGACVDTVSAESDAGNNCSAAVSITVSDNQMAIESFELDSENSNPEGIVFANDRLYVVDSFDGRVYAYRTTGERDSASDFDLDSAPSNLRGIAFANDRFYVVTWTGDTVYAYTTTGERDSASDFDLISEHTWSGGIAFANQKFYVLDEFDGEVSVYQSTGEPDSASHFDLGLANPDPTGIAFANDRIYVVNDRDDWVYAYNTSGQRASESDLYLHPDNGSPAGITFANGRVYLVDDSDDRAYILNSTDPSPDLVISAASANPPTPVTEQSFDVRVTVRNRGTGMSTATTLRFYSSTDSTISADDAEIGTDALGALARQATDNATITLTAPETAGTYYYGACVESVSGEPYTDNNCSGAVRVTVRARVPDLAVESASVNDDTPGSEGTFMFTASVRNGGTAASPDTTLRFYRSDDRTISTNDTQVGTDAVSELAIDSASTHSISLPAPTDAGTYYYGACVDAVAEESNARNNCSSAVPVFGGGPFPAYDLAISSATVHPPNFVPIGTAIPMSVTVINRGPNRSQPAKLRFGSVSHQDIPALDSGESTTIRSTIGYVSRGTTTYRACIVEAPGEGNTSNNCVSRTVTYL